jgi:hypothetical protein
VDTKYTHEQYCFLFPCASVRISWLNGELYVEQGSAAHKCAPDSCFHCNRESLIHRKNEVVALVAHHVRSIADVRRRKANGAALSEKKAVTMSRTGSKWSNRLQKCQEKRRDWRIDQPFALWNSDHQPQHARTVTRRGGRCEESCEPSRVEILGTSTVPVRRLDCRIRTSPVDDQHGIACQNIGHTA